MRRGNTINIWGKCTGPRNQFDISDRVEIGGVEITRVNCISIIISLMPILKHAFPVHK